MDAQQQEAAVKIQSKYRQFQSKSLVDDMRQEAAATKIQAGIRGYRDRKKVKTIRLVLLLLWRGEGFANVLFFLRAK